MPSEPPMPSQPGGCSENIKIVMLGNRGAGKTSFLAALPGTEFADRQTNIKPTVGNKNADIMVSVKTGVHTGTIINVDLWDAGGAVLRGYGPIIGTYYEDARAAVIVYDSSNSRSFEDVRTFWIPEAKKMLGEQVPLSLVATHKPNQVKTVSDQTGRAFANGHRMQFCSIDQASDSQCALEDLVQDACIYMFRPLGEEDEETLKKIVDTLRAEKDALALELEKARQLGRDNYAKLMAAESAADSLRADAEANMAEMQRLQAADEEAAKLRDEAANIAAQLAQQKQIASQGATSVLGRSLKRLFGLESAHAVEEWKSKIAGSANKERGDQLMKRIGAKWFLKDIADKVNNWKSNKLQAVKGDATSQADKDAAARRDAKAAGEDKEAEMMLGQQKQAAQAAAESKKNAQEAQKQFDALQGVAEAAAKQAAEALDRLAGEKRLAELEASRLRMITRQTIEMMNQMRLALDVVYAEVHTKQDKVEQLMKTDWIAEMPRVYQQHKLEPLCENKVFEVVSVWDKMYYQVNHSFKKMLREMDGHLAKAAMADLD